MALTLDEILAFCSVSDVQLSPDGERFAFVVGDNHTTLLEVEKQPVRVSHSHIWLCGVSPGSVARQLTRGPRSDSLPRWSPDGETLAFLSDRAVLGQSQIYTLRVAVDATAAESTDDDDGAAALTDVVGDIPTPRGLNAVQWDPDGQSIAFLLEEQPEHGDAAAAEREFGDDALEYEAHPAFVRVYRVAVGSKVLSVVSPVSAGQIWEFAPGPGGSIAAVVSDSPFEWSWYACRLVAFGGDDEADEKVRELASPMSDGGGKSPAQSRQVAQPQWSPDGQKIAFVTSTWSDRGCVAGTLMVVNADGTVTASLAARVHLLKPLTGSACSMHLLT
jgi:dipeptidyl aminopeptidase/acylaminoacyl peptidase